MCVCIDYECIHQLKWSNLKNFIKVVLRLVDYNETNIRWKSWMDTLTTQCLWLWLLLAQRHKRGIKAVYYILFIFLFFLYFTSSYIFSTIYSSCGSFIELNECNVSPKCHQEVTFCQIIILTSSPKLSSQRHVVNMTCLDDRWWKLLSFTMSAAEITKLCHHTA